MEKHPVFSQVRYDRFSHQEILADGTPIEKRHGNDARLWCEDNKLYAATKELMLDALDVIARRNEFDSLLDHLAALPTWDGNHRLSTWPTVYCGAKDSDYVRQVGRMFLISMMARAHAPGCQVDYTLALGGAPRKGKTTICRLLGGSFYRTPSAEIGSLTSHSEMEQAWFVEFNDTKGLSGVKGSVIKEFLQLTHDFYTPKYEKQARNVPRHCVFCVTYNPSDDGTGWLKDTTARDRFWVVTTGEINADAFARDRDQLLAEALVAYQAGEKWWPSDYKRFLEAQGAAANDHDDICANDGWGEEDADALIEEAKRRHWRFVSARMLLTKLDVPPAQQIGKLTLRANEALKNRLGEKRKHRFREGSYQGYEIPGGYITPYCEYDENFKFGENAVNIREVPTLVMRQTLHAANPG